MLGIESDVRAPAAFLTLYYSYFSVVAIISPKVNNTVSPSTSCLLVLFGVFH